MIGVTQAAGPNQNLFGTASSSFGTSYVSATEASELHALSWDWSADPEADTVDGVQVAIELKSSDQIAEIAIVGTPNVAFGEVSGDATIPFEAGDDGRDRVLILCEQVEDIDSTGVSYGGQGLTLAEAATGGDKEAKIWYLLDPPAGVANVVITYGAADTVLKTGVVFVLRRVDQANPVGAVDNLVDETSSTTPSISLTTTEDRSWIVDSVKSGGSAGALTADPSQTQLEPRNLTGQQFDTAGASLEPTEGAGSATMSWTSASADVWSIAAVEFLLSTGNAVVRDLAVSYEAALSLAPQRAVPQEALLSLTRLNGALLEALASVRRDVDVPLEALTTLAPADLETYEALTELLRQRTAPTESLKILVREGPAPTEALAGINRTVLVPLEAESAALVRELTFPLESVVNLRRVFTVPIESLLPLARVRVSSVEAQALLRRDRIVPLELVSAFVAVSRSAALPLEALVR